jgi:hypothetical protein
MKCFQLCTKTKFALACIPSIGLKDSEKTGRIMELSQELGIHQLMISRTMDIFTTEQGTKTLYGNMGNKATSAMQQPRTAKTSNTLQ